jgi:hypothetical protein
LGFKLGIAYCSAVGCSTLKRTPSQSHCCPASQRRTSAPSCTRRSTIAWSGGSDDDSHPTGTVRITESAPPL